jgi:hypothetical protein
MTFKIVIDLVVVKADNFIEVAPTKNLLKYFTSPRVRDFKEHHGGLHLSVQLLH